MKINWGIGLDPPLLVLPKHELNKYGYEQLKARTEEFGLRGFVVLEQWPDRILAVYRRW